MDRCLSARCSTCGLNYPPHMAETLCPNCEITRLDEDPYSEPDPELARLHGSPAQFQAASGSSTPLRDRIAAEGKTPMVRRDDNGLLWVGQAELEAAGYWRLQDFDQVEIGGCMYELQGFRPSSGDWWLELVGAA